MSKTASGKKRYTVTGTVSGAPSNPNESHIFEHKFCSDNPSKYLDKYRDRLYGYGWANVAFDMIEER